ncbi:hypothetical protein [Mucilaginibacter sp. UYNi724]
MFTLGYLNPASAQKAYDLIKYQASVYGNKTTLQLADGYLLASKVTIHSKFGDQVFSPQANEPDNQGNLQLSFVKGGGRLKDNKGSWMLLKNLNGPEYPLQISAVYWDGKMKKAVVFKQQN